MNHELFPPGSLRAALRYEPQPLKFGTSGRRGEVAHLTQLEVYLNARAELDYLLSLPTEQGGVRRGQDFFLAHDLRPSSTRLVPEQGGRGELAQAIHRAIRDAGLRPVNLGALPTPALTAFALARGAGSMMVTGSHIPFDRNGYKTNSARGELLKDDEAPINERVAAWRARLYAEPFATSLFDEMGRFKAHAREPLPAADGAGREHYLRRYTSFFADESLRGLRLVVYQHSAVGRDLLVDLLRALGAEVIPAGRSESFVPIDTEAIDDATLEQIRQLAANASAAHGPVDAVVSTDGDSDRPLLVGMDYATDGSCRARFFGGDLVGMVVAEFLGADAVVVPISCNDAIDRGPLQPLLEPKTKIGSPYVIAGMLAAQARGRRRVCGWEANGGFLTGSDFERGGRVLPALPTRDAFLPILCVLLAMRRRGWRMSALFDALPRRFSRAALLRRFPRSASLNIVAGLTQNPGRIAEFFTPELGFGAVARLDTTDGARIYFANGDVAHVRPSGNADELRIYAVADTQARADEIARLGVAEPDGILRRLERAFAGSTG
ncbi:MAG: phosphomannomutase [Limisphaerales bacterium]|jgi:phosphomannomutase